MSPGNLDLDDLLKELPLAFWSSYELGPVLGRGGQGIAIKAFQRSLRRLVVLKFLIVEDPLQVLRFEREAEILSRIRHSSIVRLYESGSHGSVRYMSLEYIEGRSLHQVMREEPLHLFQILNIMRDLLAGLEMIHSLELVHRDIKPANIILLPDGRPKLIDFGIARDVAGSRLTEAGSFVGTPGYASPEQILGEAADARSDLYSLGVVLHEAITGTNPFEAGSVAEIAQNHISLPITGIVGSRVTPHPRLENLVVELLRKQPELRPATARHALRMLEEPGLAPRETESLGTPGPCPPASPVRRRSARIDPRPGSLDPAPPKKSWRSGRSMLFLASAAIVGMLGVRHRTGPSPGPTIQTSPLDPRIPTSKKSIDLVEINTLVAGITRARATRHSRKLQVLDSPYGIGYDQNLNELLTGGWVEMILEFRGVEDMLRKWSQDAEQGDLTPREAIAMASLRSARYLLWAELVGCREATLDSPLADYPRADLARFYRSVPRKLETRGAFYLKSALQSLGRALESCLDSDRAPESFGELVETMHAVSWFTDVIPWTPSSRAVRDEELHRFEVSLRPETTRPDRVLRVQQLVLAVMEHARIRLTQQVPESPPDLEPILDHLVKIGYLSPSQRDISLEGFRKEPGPGRSRR